MAWKKVVVSGSAAELSGLTVDNTIVGTVQTASYVEFDGVDGLTAFSASVAANIESAEFQLSINGDAGDGPDVIGDGDTITIAGGTNINTLVTSSVGGANKVTVNLDTKIDLLEVTASIVSASNGFVGDLTGTADTASYVVGASVVGAVVTANTASYVLGSGVDGAVVTADTASYVLLAAVDGFGAESSSIASRITVLEQDGPENASTASFVDGDDVEFLASGNGQTATAFSSSAASRITTIEGTGTIQGVGTTNNVTFANITGTNITATGNLTVQGTVTSIETTNLNVDDQFILLNSGSTSAADAGIVAYDDGPSLGWDESEGRWALDATGSTWNQTTITSDAYIAAVKIGATDANYEKAGNLRVDGGEIYIYV